jgi:predicted O-methyltransferase YrrM
MTQTNFGKVLQLAGRAAKIVFRNPKGLRELCGVASASAEQLTDPEVDVTRLPKVSIEEILADVNEATVISLWALPQVARSINLHEAACIGALLKLVRARRVFEFGTYRGFSTTQIVLNMPPDGRVFTLDLPLTNLTTKFELDTPGEFEVVQDTRKGELIPNELRERITFMAQDSALFDPKPYEGTMDLVFVDGAHTAEYVKNDSEKGWQMLRPGGVICWHDCRFNSPGVIKYLLRCPYGPKRIAGGSVAFARKPAGQADI